MSAFFIDLDLIPFLVGLVGLLVVVSATRRACRKHALRTICSCCEAPTTCS